MQKFSARTALAVVIANMVGTGVFTSLGYQLLDIQSGFAILLLWLVGGITALCGALTYAELGAALPRSGGEYNFLSEIYHPSAGFVAGLVSATLGFAAPIALVAITFGVYLQQVFPGLPQMVSGIALILVLSTLHARSYATSAGIQQIFTVVKVVLILGFCLAAWLFAPDPQPVSFTPVAADLGILGTAGFAVALIYVNYAYTGWNAATYLTGELENPQRSLPRVLVTGTLVVTVLYVALNASFLHVASMDSLAGQIEIGYIAGAALFGSVGGAVMALMLAMLLISTVSAMTLAGPRVLQVMGEDYTALSPLAKPNQAGIPVRAIALQTLVAILLVVTATFESILVFTGFLLGLNTLVTVLGVFVLRWRRPDLPRPYRINLFPLPPLVFVAITLWTLVHILLERPQEGSIALAVICVAGAFYAALARHQTKLEARTAADKS